MFKSNVDRVHALRTEKDTLLDFCADLSDDEWTAPSRAEGWLVRDVVAHLSASCHVPFQPSAIKETRRTAEIERFNDLMVERRASWSRGEIVDELQTWGKRIGLMARVTQLPGLSSTQQAIGELGKYPMWLVPSILTFDFHTHLRHDIAPALDRRPPRTDDVRMTAVNEWLLAMLEKVGAPARTWMDGPLGLVLDGPGAGRWILTPAGDGRLQIEASEGSGVEARISGTTAAFPCWTTGRAAWRDHLQVDGDTAYAARFLDTVKLI